MKKFFIKKNWKLIFWSFFELPLTMNPPFRSLFMQKWFHFPLILFPELFYSFFLFKNRGFMTLTQEKDYFFNIMYTHIYVEMALLYLTTSLVLCFMFLSFAFALYNPHLKALHTKHDN